MSTTNSNGSEKNIHMCYVLLYMYYTERKKNAVRCYQLLNLGEEYTGVHCIILATFLKV